MATWPSALPAPRLGFSGTSNPRALLRTSGPVANIQRNVGEDGLLICSAQWKLTATQYETFQAWYWFKIFNGAAWFSITLKMEAVAEERRARFVDGYAGNYIGRDKWEISAVIELRP